MDKAAHPCKVSRTNAKGASMSTAQYARSRKYRFSPSRPLHILVATVGLLQAISAQAQGVYFQNSYGLVSPSNIVTFSEFSPPPNTIITTEYQAYGVTFVPYVNYASIYNQTSGTPHIDPTTCVANFIQFSPPLSTFSILFGRPVSSAAFAVLTQPGTFDVTALLGGTEIPGGPHTFIGGYGPDATNNFVGLSDVTFDELRISNVATSDGALVLDNLQFTPAPESPPTLTIHSCVEVCWQSRSGVRYQLQRSPAPHSDHWENVGSPVTGTGDQVCVTDPQTGLPKRTYRLAVLP
jgi:hypothetical protein